MNKIRIAISSMCLLSSILACSDDDTSAVVADATVDASDASTGDTTVDATQDATSSGCAQAELLEWEAQLTDVSVWAQSEISPSLFGRVLVFRALFERYSPDPDVGTFDLSQGPDESFGTCQHCMYAFEDGNPDTVYYAEAGTLELRSDPYDRRFDMTVTGLRLVESTVGEGRTHTPVPDGNCIDIPSFTLQRAFPGAKWSCDIEKFADGTDCHCDCGDFDPDCAGKFPEPAPAPVDCGEGGMCGFDPVGGNTMCLTACDWAARTACTDAICVFDDARGSDECIAQTERFADVAIGESCGAGNLQKYCNLVDTDDGRFADGYCGPADVCRSVCDDDADCSEDGESCRWFLQPGQGYGYCGPPPPEDG